MLPVIETEILPTKHYTHSPDGKMLTEIPESVVPGRTTQGRPSLNWEIRETENGRGDHGASLHKKLPTTSSKSRIHSPHQSHHFHSSHSSLPPASGDEGVAAGGPVIGLARADPRANRSRASSRASTKSGSRTRNIFEPILSAKKEIASKDGVPKTEYVWRHAPVFEDATGKTQHVYTGPGLGNNQIAETYSDEDEDVAGKEFGSMRREENGGEEFLFRDSGYGSQGALPGLEKKSAIADLRGVWGSPPAANGVNSGDEIRLGRVLGEDQDEGIDTAKVESNGEGEATKALRRMRERRRNSVTSQGNSLDLGSSGANTIYALENGFERMAM